jgi:hypothetical protein
MATRLTKPVARETSTRYRGRPLIVELRPAEDGRCDQVIVHEKGRRTGFGLPVETIYILAARHAAEEASRVTGRGVRRRTVSRGLLG